MKAYFLTGLAIILPIILTIFFIGAVVNILTTPFLGIIEYLFPTVSLDPFFIKGIVLIILFFATTAIGYSAEHFVVNTILGWGNSLIRKIPLVGNIYQMIQDIIQTFYGKQEQFSKVGKVFFPNSKTTTLGFITNGEIHIQGKEDLGAFASVYIPGNPNPIMGFWVLVPKDKLVALDISAKEASRFIFSCGVLKAENSFDR